MGKKRRSGMRRSYLKRFSSDMVNTGQGMGKGFDNYEVAIRLPQLATKGLSEEIPPTISLGTSNSPRRVVMERLVDQKKLMQTDFFQKIQTYHFVMLRQGSVNKLKMFFGGNEAFFIEENHLTGVVKRSIVYKGREKAMQRFRLEQITWVETCRLPETTGANSERT